jgi:hypothetical protein
MEIRQKVRGIATDDGMAKLTLLDLADRGVRTARVVALSPPALDYANLHLPVAEHAAASTVWMEHRLLLAERGRVLLVAEAAARIREHAAAIMEKMPIGAGA